MREHERELELVRLWILTSWQNQGIGTAFLEGLCARADDERVPIRLRVLKVNPARALYERFGFGVARETETHYIMRREV